jgi:O-antigen ligase
MQSTRPYVEALAPTEVMAPAELWRERAAGFGMAIGLCCPYVFSSVSSIPWWAFVPVAFGSAMLRWKSYRKDWMPLLPVIVLTLVMAVFSLLALAYHPMPVYWLDKVGRYLLFGGVTFLFAIRMAPATEEMTRGLRWGLAVTLLAALVVTIQNRDMFLDTQFYGMKQMREMFSVTGFPLSIAMAAACFLPRTLKPLPLLTAGALLLLVAALEVFVRGRFGAMMLAGMAVLLVVGPPWKHLGWRLCISVLIVAALAWIYVDVLPDFGESYQYLEEMAKSPLGGRENYYTVAWRGFLEHPLGNGIGSFAMSKSLPLDHYPHNVVLEAAYEYGLLGLLVMAWLYGMVFRKAWILWQSPPHRTLAAVLVVVFLYMLKAGDIATWAIQWVYLYVLVVVIPISPSWPLLRGSALR